VDSTFQEGLTPAAFHVPFELCLGLLQQKGPQMSQQEDRHYYYWSNSLKKVGSLRLRMQSGPA